MDMFLSGQPQTLMMILDNKDERQGIKQMLLRDNPDKTVISITINIPGDIKNNEAISQVFKTAVTAFERYLKDNNVPLLISKTRSLDTGPEYYAVVNQGDLNVKQVCINFEQFYTVGRLLDIDVYQQSETGELIIIDRDKLQMKPRQCLICEKPAKECTRERTHSIVDLRQKINQLCENLL